MDISENTRKCVAFLGIRVKDEFHPKATCFFVNYLDLQHNFHYLVTAEHVVSGLLSQNHDIWLRANLVDGDNGELPIDSSQFYYHPDAGRDQTDVAVLPIAGRNVTDRATGETATLDTQAIRINGDDSFGPTLEFQQQCMGLGSPVAIVGLFRSHYGKNRNVPLVRMGNVAARSDPKEPILTPIGYIEAYLIEAMSIAGLSGSPVFSLMGEALFLSRALGAPLGEYKGQTSALLGLVHGHFDVKNLNEDVVSDSANESINTGIGVVVPFHKILEAIEQPELADMRKAIITNLRKAGATADLDLPSAVAAAIAVEEK